MITVLVQFKLPYGTDRSEMEGMFSSVAPMYYEIPGLIRKYFLIAEDCLTAGGIYIWRSRKDAESFYNESFSLSIIEKFGSEPTVTYFDSPVVVDNVSW
jgi:hypothetical protein